MNVIRPTFDEYQLSKKKLSKQNAYPEQCVFRLTEIKYLDVYIINVRSSAPNRYLNIVN